MIFIIIIFKKSAAINMPPFKALYGYDPLISLGSSSSSKVEAVDEILKERQSIGLQLQQQLKKTQDRMKMYADKKRTEKYSNGNMSIFEITALSTNQCTIEAISNLASNIMVLLT
jgi:hypothetical protein